MTEFGLALGGGGVKGLAHIALLKKLDELGVRPHAIAGTSMGAIIGALYSAGLSGADIEQRVRDHLFTRGEGIKSAYKRRQHLVKWVKVFSLKKSRGGLFTADGLFEHLFTEIRDLTFADLNIPFTAVATHFHTGKEIAIREGGLLKAVQASMAVPGIFAPIKLGGKLLIDGGLINNVPCNHVAAENRLILASDVICLSKSEDPKATQVLNGALNIMLHAATEREFEDCPPDYVFRPDTNEIDAFDFHKIATVLDRGELEITKSEASLKNLLLH